VVVDDVKQPLNLIPSPVKKKKPDPIFFPAPKRFIDGINKREAG
jgi:hypothetical protein